jgi:bacterioferritin-associated ferredoxin
VLVCQCEAVNDRQIVDEIVCGALDPERIAERCGAGSRCGGCRPTIEALLASLGLAEQPAA